MVRVNLNLSSTPVVSELADLANLFRIRIDKAMYQGLLPNSYCAAIGKKLKVGCEAINSAVYPLINP